MRTPCYKCIHHTGEWCFAENCTISEYKHKYLSNCKSFVLKEGEEVQVCFNCGKSLNIERSPELYCEDCRTECVKQDNYIIEHPYEGSIYYLIEAIMKQARQDYKTKTYREDVEQFIQSEFCAALCGCAEINVNLLRKALGGRNA